MTSFTVSVAGHTYYLPANADVADLQDRLVHAVRDGGDVVVIPAAGEREVSVLVSPGLPVFFEERPDSPSARPTDVATAPDDGIRSGFTLQEWDSF
jgi:hypothetical protein